MKTWFSPSLHFVDNKTMDKQKTKFILKFLVVFLICVIAGVRYFSLPRVNPLDGAERHYGDQITYNYLANQLLHDRIYAEEGPPETRARAWRPPGYPIFLALLLWLGRNDLQFVISVQYLLLLFIGISVFYLGSKTSHSFLGGLLACVAFYSFAPIGHFASLIMSETLFTFGICFFLVFLYEGLRTRRAVFHICAGCLLGLSALVRTVTLPFLGAGIVLLPVGWVLLRVPKYVVMLTRLGRVNPEQASHNCGRVEALPGGYLTQISRLRNLSLLIISAWLMVIPVTVRNYLVFHDFVPVATSDGMNFYFGTKSPFDFDYEHKTAVVPSGKFGEVGQRNELLKLAFKTISLNPGKYLLHKIKTIGCYVMPNLRMPNLQMSNVPYHNLPDFFSYTEKTERITHFLFWIGCLTLVIRRDLWSYVFLLFYWGLVVSSSLTFLTDSRFQIVTLPCYFIICACGVTGVLHGVRRAAGRLFQNDQQLLTTDYTDGTDTGGPPTVDCQQSVSSVISVVKKSSGYATLCSYK
ncbi:MAG: hypothetical protein KKC28_14805 [Verrucomicrobia bacterium]|nr:hypothetical protein [Verrucomicrobiota bacterium]